MKKIYSLFLIMAIATSVAIGQSGSPSTTDTGAADITFLLPRKANLDFRWASPAADADFAAKISQWSNQLQLSVDRNGSPWIALAPKGVLNPQKELLIKITQPITGMATLENGAMMFSTPTDLGIIAAPESGKKQVGGFAEFPIQPITSIPYQNSRMYSGVNNYLYFVGINPLTQEYDLLSIQVKSTGTEKEIPLGNFSKIFSTTEKITAVAGDGNVTYVALGNLVIKLSGLNKEPEKVLTLDNRTVQELAYFPGSGLIYSTDRQIGFAGEKGFFDFLSLPEHAIARNGDKLFILIRKNLAILSIDRIPELVKAPIPLGQPKKSNDLQIVSAKFFEYGPPDFTGSAYDDLFDKTSARLIACDIQFKNLNIKKAHHHGLTLSWKNEAGDCIKTETKLIRFSPTDKDLKSLFSMGSDIPGSWTPGTYTVQIYADGALLNESKFDITGDITLFDALKLHNETLFKNLLDNKANPNQVDNYGTPLLLEVVSQGTYIELDQLIRAGADLNVLNKKGESALFIAGYGSDSEDLMKAEILLSAGINREIKDQNGMTAFFRMAQADHFNPRFLSLLKSKNSNINATDPSGRNALIAAILNNSGDPHDEILYFLIKSGVNLKDAIYHIMNQHPDPKLVQACLENGYSFTPQGPANNQPNGSGTLLAFALHNYSNSVKNRDYPNSQAYGEISQMLINKGACLSLNEEKMILDPVIWKFLEQPFLLSILSHNPDFLLPAAKIDDPEMQDQLIDKLIANIKQGIQQATSVAELKGILAKSNEVIQLVEQTKGQNHPELYLYSGMLENQLGISLEAANHLKKYVGAVDPATSNLKEVNDLIKRLDRANRPR